MVIHGCLMDHSWNKHLSIRFVLLLPKAFRLCQVNGTPERPRMSIFRSNKHLYVQVIDDSKMHTLASASTMQKPISEEHDYSSGPTLVSLLNLINNLVLAFDISRHQSRLSCELLCIFWGTPFSKLYSSDGSTSKC